MAARKYPQTRGPLAYKDGGAVPPSSDQTERASEPALNVKVELPPDPAPEIAKVEVTLPKAAPIEAESPPTLRHQLELMRAQQAPPPPQQVSPKKLAFVRENPHIPVGLLGSVHAQLMAEGVPDDSDRYFSEVARRIRQIGASVKYPDHVGHVRKVPVSAPVSRAVPSAGGGRPASGRVELSLEQREAARIAGVDEFTYARGVQRLAALKAQGLYGNEG
jgi:hypothetical protein